MAIRRKKSAPRPYWLSGFEVLCAACEASHAHAVTIRCVACDSSLCPVCVVHVEGEHFCSGCTPSDKPARSRARSERSR